MRPERAVEQRINDASERFRIGQVSSVVGNQLIVTTSRRGKQNRSPTGLVDTRCRGHRRHRAHAAGWVALGKIA
jgi:hypothetical protein